MGTKATWPSTACSGANSYGMQRKEVASSSNNPTQEKTQQNTEKKTQNQTQNKHHPTDACETRGSLGPPDTLEGDEPPRGTHASGGFPQNERALCAPKKVPFGWSPLRSDSTQKQMSRKMGFTSKRHGSLLGCSMLRSEGSLTCLLCPLLTNAGLQPEENCTFVGFHQCA